MYDSFMANTAKNSYTQQWLAASLVLDVCSEFLHIAPLT